MPPPRIQLGPDAYRYLSAADGVPQARPFHLRWLMPTICGKDIRWWWACWAGAWLLLAASAVGWRMAAGDGWARSLAVAALLCGLPGILGPSVVIPVGVDLPATALAVTAAMFTEMDGRWLVAAALAACWAGTVKESTPIVAALTAWSVVPLVGLAAPLVRHIWCRSRGLIGEDPLGPRFQAITDHPFRSSLAAHAGRWRDGWLWVAPWGVCLAALYAPTPQVVVALVAAWAVVLVATDTVRLQHHMAGPVMAAAAVSNIPTEWLALAVVLHVWWFRVPERI